ncbi:methionine ABC transporter ATP-binding protein [Clostridium isatidis]|mgnify:FL=1|uniref:Methionine ABC transporter ATP-binding protein n=1 Tax=Clostridium isatidis TaxID=182773 RepID=A0A343JE59_9CLOT|nr:methionine ABC transporter ATP-binding protein [Clostridium isatidis]ASW43817.1 methionine ABC transporter ATP-binding protein [Clostridium isatidis]NLZ35413.1 methionine ABC transporter ATP-binding protein [Clostridiales bacterium]
MIEITNLSKSFNNTEVLKNVSVHIKEGEIYGIIGHSGAGKSTLLRCINGLEAYDKGTIKVNGKEVEKLKGYRLREFRKDLGMIFQSFNLLKRKTVFENVALPLEVWGYEEEYKKYKEECSKEGKKSLGYKKYQKEKIEKRVNELLSLVGLSEKANEKTTSLSGGQKQRVAIARALALEPKILLCDEATSALDPKTTKDILQLLLKINKELGITIVVVTHQMEVVKEVCERVTLLEGGIVKAEGRAEDLFLNPGLSLKKFLGDDEDELLPNEGVNIRLFFPSNSSENALITKMAKELDVDFSIVWGKLEKFRDNVLGSLVINIDEKDQIKVIEYLEKKNIILEVIN